MSAESPKRTPRLPTIVPPEPVSDRSIIESVTGFINEVTLTNVPPVDQKDQIQWVRFETTADISNPSFGEDYDLESGVPPPLILILGYKTGIQIWAIPANGEATEVLSWRHGVVRCLKVLPTPISSYVADNNASEPSDDMYAHKRPLMAICESAQVSSTGPQFCTMNIISLHNGETIKSIKFKNTILEIAANHQSIVVTFAERIAVFDARTLEDRLTITACYPSPGLSPNPIALGPRWLAYAERKMIPAKRSAGGCDGDGVSTYTATVLNAAKTLGKGLRELGEQVAAGLTGTGAPHVSAIGSMSTTAASNSGSSSSSSGGEQQQLHPGIVTILDIKEQIKDTCPTGTPVTVSGNDPIIAHFVAHTDVIAGMTFDASGLLLLTADKRGHDFHVFRINPHPCGPTSAAVHHLYILHRGDTTAKVQDMIFSLDSRWAAVTTARGTTHVFPVSPYGGPATFRTHGSAEVVNRLSRFHRSAGLSADGRSSSPICPNMDGGAVTADPYHNPRLPPFPRPQIVMPLKQLRQPLILMPPNGLSAAATAAVATTSTTITRQRQSSVSDDAGNVLRVCATFARPRDWLLQPLQRAVDMPALRSPRNAVDSLFVMAGHGSMIQYDLEPRYISSIPASKQNDDSPIELHVEAKAQWNLLRKDGSIEIQPPLSGDNWLLKNRLEFKDSSMDMDVSAENDERWLSQVEIVTSSGPHRRLWMGPQFIFKTYNTPSGSTLQHIDSEAVEIGVNCPANRPARSNPMQTPSIGMGRNVVPVLIESGSASSIEQSPRFTEQFQEYLSTEDLAIMPAETQLREDLADAMRESPRDSGLPTNQTTTTTTWSGSSSSSSSLSSLSATAAAAIAPHARSSIAKVVNPLGTVTTIIESQHERSPLDADEFAEEYSSGAYIHENCDESMFRPYVAVISGSIDDGIGGGSGIDAMGKASFAREKPEPIGQKLIVPVIDSAQLEKQNREKSRQLEMKRRRQDDEAKRRQDEENVAKFEQMSLLNRKQDKSKTDPKVEEATRKKSTATDEKKSLSSSKNVMASKEPEKSSEEKLNESMTKSEKKGKIETETVTVKLKKKPNKAQASKSIEPSIECDDTVTKKTKSPAVAVELSQQKCDNDPIVEFVAPKPIKSKKKQSATESGGSSKESSVEKDLVMITAATATVTLASEKPPEPVVEPTSKSKKKKQRKSAAAAISTSSSDDAKGESASEQLVVLKGSSTETKTVDSTAIGHGNPFLMEDIERVDSAKCAEIQQSLLKTSISATVSIRKGSYQEKQHRRDAANDGDDEKPSTSVTLPLASTSSASGKSGKKKKWSKESIDSIDAPASSNNSPNSNIMDEFTYPDPELTDADNLSFKSTIDDHITLIPLESIANDDVEWPSLGKAGGSGAAVASEYDKLSDEAEAEMGSSGTQYADCKNFQMIVDEPESYMRTTTATISDTNSSDEMEDSSKSTKSTSEKIIDDDDDDDCCGDEELQPLIRSTASDSAAADLSTAKGSDDNTLPNQSDSLAQPAETAPAAAETVTAEANEPSQSQKPTNSSTTTSGSGGGGSGGNSNNNNKKKFRKKRR